MARTPYATPAQLRTYTGLDSTALPDADASALIASAERDLDSVAVTRRQEDDGHRFVVGDLNTREAAVLANAACAQAEYRREMGNAFFVRAQFETSKGPDFESTGTLPYIGPKVWRELAGSGLVKMSTSGQGRSRPPWYSFAYNDTSGDLEEGPKL